jgi:alcohol dehydrogenase (cytochrome c)
MRSILDSKKYLPLLLVLLMPSILLHSQDPGTPEVSFPDLVQGLGNPTRWPTYSGNYSGDRHSPLTQIDPSNVDRLVAQWTFQAGQMPLSRGWEATPIVVDGTIYITGNNNFAWAIDARTGREIWSYRRQLPDGLTYGGANLVNRGFGVLGERLFMATLDANLIALDRNTGAVLWESQFADYTNGHAATLAPLVVKDKVIVGNSGGDYPTRGFIDAYDAETGERVWRFYTIPGPGEPGSETWPNDGAMARGGGATWATGSYDPELDLVYWGTGNPNPDYYGGDRLGDNLYTASIVALDADTGELRWHFQFTPHDLHDWDSNHTPILSDLTIDGRERRVVMVANRNGFFYTLDRETGELLLGTPFTGTQWARELDSDGRPIVLNDGMLAPGDSGEGVACVPDLRGGTNFNPSSYDPERGLFFVFARESCAFYVPRPEEEPREAQLFMAGALRQQPEPSYSALRAIDAATGERRWEYRFDSLGLAGVTSTASGLVFAGNQEGEFGAFDSETGNRLWHYYTGYHIHGAAATTYMLDGRQWVLIPSGAMLTAFSLPDR